MAKSYAEFLAEQGATADEIKVLDVPAARKGYEAVVAKAEAAERKTAADLKAREEWAATVETQNQTYLKERDSAKIEAAKANAAYETMQKLGLVEVAERLEPGSTKVEKKESPEFDASKYVTSDTLLAVAEREGDAIAIAQDISFEHSQLFGGDSSKRLNFRELRREAVARKIPVESLWMEKYGVQAARDARAAADKAAYEKKVADDAITRYKSEHPESNPLMQPPSASRTPFTERIPSAGDTTRTHPWQKSETETGNARVQKVLQNLSQAGLVH